MPIAIVPIRTHRPKSRLATVLDPRERDHLVSVLFSHVLGCLKDQGLEVVVLCRGRIEPMEDVRVIEDPAQTLNASLHLLVGTIPGPVVVIAADLPWLDTDAVARLIEEPGDVVIARTRDGGTAALSMTEPIPVSFGPRSALAHAASGHAAGRHVRVVEIQGMDRDLDDPAALITAVADAPSLRDWRRRESQTPGP